MVRELLPMTSPAPLDLPLASSKGRDLWPVTDSPDRKPIELGSLFCRREQFKNEINEQESHLILVSGKSGAGKTETKKELMTRYVISCIQGMKIQIKGVGVTGVWTVDQLDIEDAVIFRLQKRRMQSSYWF